MKVKHQLGISEKVEKTKTFNKVHNKMLMFVSFGKYLFRMVFVSARQRLRIKVVESFPIVGNGNIFKQTERNKCRK